MRKIFGMLALVLPLLAISMTGCNTEVDNTAETPQYDDPGPEVKTDTSAEAPPPPPPDTP